MIRSISQIHGIAILGLLAFLLTSKADAGDAPQAKLTEAPTLRDELVIRIERDQEARRAAIAWGAERGIDGIVDEETLNDEERADRTSLWDMVAEIDADNTQWLKNVVSEQGWLKYSDVGIDGGDAAWLIVQHADADPSFQRQCLDLMSKLRKNEMSQSNLALLTDRVLLAEGKNQIYGTQFVARDGEWVPHNLEDEDNVDARRAEVGLPPLAEYREMLKAVMRGEEIE